jgi:ubiquinone/menaquinone biosynthesis C-methylase UbiE
MPGATNHERIREANERYHDVAAAEYDAKWGIDFGQIGRDQVRAKFAKALGAEPLERYARGLEIGSGTGYFSLNLMQEGIVERLVATDISSGMLETLAATAERLGLAERVETEHTGAESLPFEDASFDLVFGHAVLHHIPDLDRAFREFARVLRPGGTLLFCGEPSRNGDRLAVVPKRLGALMAPLWRRMLGAGARNGHGPDAAGADGHEHDDAHALEGEVDVHAFAPGELRDGLKRAGFEAVRVGGEELVANVYGWWLRSLEASAEPDQVPMAWRQFAFRSYIALQRLDEALLEPRLPAALFYNLVLSARKPH